MTHSTLFAALLLLARPGRPAAAAPCTGVEQDSAPRPEPMWEAWHATLRERVAAADREGPVDLVVYGDSVIENFLASRWGLALPSAASDAAAFQAAFGRYRHLVLASGGEHSGNLLWRLQHGELPVRHPPRLAVVYIGTGDLTAADSECKGAAGSLEAEAAALVGRVGKIVAAIQGASAATRVLLLGQWPRGANYWDGGEAVWAWPNRYTAAIEAANAGLEAIAEARPGVGYLYCGEPFATPQGLNTTLMPDGQHPTTEGYQMVLECLRPRVEEILGPPSGEGPPPGGHDRGAHGQGGAGEPGGPQAAAGPSQHGGGEGGHEGGEASGGGAGRGPGDAGGSEEDLLAALRGAASHHPQHAPHLSRADGEGEHGGGLAEGGQVEGPAGRQEAEARRLELHALRHRSRHHWGKELARGSAGHRDSVSL